MLHLRAIAVVIMLLAVLAIPFLKYWDYLTKGMSPPPSTQLLSQMETNGVPDFALENLAGKTVRLSEIKSQITVINFWASWCAPCVKEFPSLKSLVEKMKGKVTVLAVSNDNDRADLESFLKVFGTLPEGFTIVWDKPRKISELYGTQVLPESYIVGPNRKLIRKVAGIDQWDSPTALEFFQELVGAASL